MARKSEKSLLEQCKKVTIRFSDGDAEKIATECLRNGIKPSLYVRIATNGFTNHRYLDLFTKTQTVLDETIRLRRDFNDALVGRDD